MQVDFAGRLVQASESGPLISVQGTDRESRHARGTRTQGHGGRLAAMLKSPDVVPPTTLRLKY